MGINESTETQTLPVNRRTEQLSLSRVLSHSLDSILHFLLTQRLQRQRVNESDAELLGQKMARHVWD